MRTRIRIPIASGNGILVDLSQSTRFLVMVGALLSQGFLTCGLCFAGQAIGAQAQYLQIGPGRLSAGDTLSPMLISFFGAMFLRVGVIYFLTITMGLGLPGVWFGTAIDWGLRSIVAYILFRRGRWKRIQL